MWQLGGGIRRCWLLILLIKKNLFHGLTKGAGDLESKWQTWVVLSSLNCVDGSTSDADMDRKLGLRPFLLCAQHAKARLHRYRQEYKIRPMLHRMSIRIGIPSQEMEWKPAD